MRSPAKCLVRINCSVRFECVILKASHYDISFRMILAMEKASDEEIESISNWASLKSFKHKSVKGIWNKFAEKTDIVAIDANEKNHVIAAGDDRGLVKLFRYPSDKRGAHFKKYPGHASRIGKRLMKK